MSLICNYTVSYPSSTLDDVDLLNDVDGLDEVASPQQGKFFKIVGQIGVERILSIQSFVNDHQKQCDAISSDLNSNDIYFGLAERFPEIKNYRIYDDAHIERNLSLCMVFNILFTTILKPEDKEDNDALFLAVDKKYERDMENITQHFHRIFVVPFVSSPDIERIRLSSTDIEGIKLSSAYIDGIKLLHIFPMIKDTLMESSYSKMLVDLKKISKKRGFPKKVFVKSFLPFFIYKLQINGYYSLATSLYEEFVQKRSMRKYLCS